MLQACRTNVAEVGHTTIYALEYIVRNIQLNNVTLQFLVSTDDVNLLVKTYTQ
jgi:hypothetical protein